MIKGPCLHQLPIMYSMNATKINMDETVIRNPLSVVREKQGTEAIGEGLWQGSRGLFQQALLCFVTDDGQRTRTTFFIFILYTWTMPLLRGHHLVCLHFFKGQGYDEAFIKNLEKTLHTAENEDVTVSPGADDVCAACPRLKGGRCEYSDNADEEISEMDMNALSLLSLSVSDSIRWNKLLEYIPGIFPEWYSLYCIECEWKGACENNTFFQELLKAK